MEVSRCTDGPLDSTDLTVDRNRRAIQIKIMNTAMIFYKTKLTGDPLSHNSIVDLEEDFELHDGDVATVLMGGVPSITFFNHVSSLWKLWGRFQLMGLENDFYLVHFKNKDDFDKILIGGPWRGRFKESTMVANGGQYNQYRGSRFFVLEEGRIDSAAVNHGVNSVAKEGNNEVTVDLSRYVEGTSLKAVDDVSGNRKIVSRAKGKEAVVANGHRKNLQILRPNNNGPGLHLSKGVSGFNDRANLVKSGFDGLFGNLKTQAVNFKTNLNRNKHKAYRLVTAHESGFRKENEMFQFGAMGNENMGRKVQVTVEEDMHRKKPLDIGPANHDQRMVGISEAMEDIIQAIETSYQKNKSDDPSNSLMVGMEAEMNQKKK
ncbi:hypothetical protein Golax_022153 [Gossypium laxum]|uniref:DUF4283 domain-containing protein n=1 Tax=Gossypium laxum TaxID=34288 RepID=A0A7J9ANA2_9ROSI|nr:hypothetical protein [Gossypium laxum]